MKHWKPFFRVLLCLALAGSGAACTTTYDAYGRPQQSVDPMLATAGILAAGALGYALGKDDRNDYYGSRYNRGYSCAPRYRGCDYY